MTPRTLRSFLLLKKERSKVLKYLVDDRISDSIIMGRTYDDLVKFCMNYIYQVEDFRPGIEDVGDGSYVDEVVADEEHLARQESCVRLLISPFIGERLSGSVIRKFVITLVGRSMELRDASLLSAGWDGSGAVPTMLYIRDVYRQQSKGHQYRLEVEAFSGIPSGQVWPVTQSGGQLQILIRELGAPKYEQHRPDDISGFWLLATLRYQKSRLLLEDPEVSSAMRTYNRNLVAARKQKCSGAFAALKGKLCVPCPIGRNACIRSRHNTGFTDVRKCAGGHQGFFRNKEDKYCYNCITSGAYLRYERRNKRCL